MSEAARESIAPAPAPAATQPQRSASLLIGTVSWLRDLMLSVLIAVLVILFLYRPVKVEGTSMMPSLFDQERLFINQFSYKFGIGSIKLVENYVPESYRDDRSYAPTVVPKDDYFVLGDHRSSSNDSRAWGFVPRSYIYGKAVFVFWPLDRIGSVH